MFAGIVFDMDGVLIDSHPSHRRAWQKFLRTLGKNVSEAELDFILEGRRRHEILRYFLGDLSQAELLEYGDRKDHFFQEIGVDVKPVPGVVEFLNSLEALRIPAAVATSASKKRTRWTLARLHLVRHFRAVITGDDVPESKPDPTIYTFAAQELNIAPEDLLAIEDSAAGVQAAKAAGMPCLGIGNEHRAAVLREAGADLVLPGFVGLSPSHLEQLLSRTFVSTRPEQRRLQSASPLDANEE